MPVRRRDAIRTTGALLGGALFGSALAGMPRHAGAQASAQASAQPGYPDRPVTIEVPFATGGAPHFLARLLAQGLSRAVGKPFVVRNRPGEGGMVSTCAASVAPPDGYSLLLTTNSVHALALNLRPCVGDVAESLEPISLLASTPQVLCVPFDSPFRRVEDLVAAAQAAPGAIRYVTLVTVQLPVLAFAEAFEVSVTRVLAIGPTSQIEHLTRGQAQFGFLGLNNAQPHLLSGGLRALGVSTAGRLAAWPDVPTLAESGMPGFALTDDFCLLARAGTAGPILDRLSDLTMATMRRPLTQELLAPIGIDVIASTRAQAAAYMDAQGRRWADTLRHHDINALP